MTRQAREAELDFWRETAKDWEAIVDALLYLIQAPPIEAYEPYGVTDDGEIILTDAGPMWVEGHCGDDPAPRQVRIGADSDVAAALLHLRAKP